jgi:hypothetical protein
MDDQSVPQAIQTLIESWCDRRALRALRCILRGYPLSSIHTDGWAKLILALKEVRALAREEVTPDELKTVDECIRVIERIVARG